MNQPTEHSGKGHVYEQPTAGVVIGQRATDRIRISDVIHNRATCIPEHAHERASLNLIVAGRYPEKCVDRAEQEFPVGHLVYKPPQQPHTNSFDGRYVRSLVVELSPCQFDSLSQEDEAFQNCWQAFQPRANAIAQRLFYEFLDPDQDSPKILESLAYELLSAAPNLPRRQTTRSHPRWIDRVVDFLNAEFPNAPTIETLAYIAGISPTHFARGFKLATGYTCGEFIRGRRVAAALEQLERGDASGSEIAANVGFADESHMIRTVRKTILATPGSFRRRAQIVASLGRSIA